MAAAQGAEYQGDETGLTWFLKQRMYTYILPGTFSKNGTSKIQKKHNSSLSLKPMETETAT